MRRAAILIGVHKTANLPTLHAVLDGVTQMESWALAQGMERQLVRTITDKDHPVTASDIELAVVEVLDTDGLEQLIIYFAGHGVVVSYNEYWLLSRALQLSSQSVNVRGSIARAQNCGVKHVVLLSDACRTAPKTLREQGTVGTIIFPNPKDGASISHVDVFYATRLNEPALEIDTNSVADSFRAVYTDSLLEALNGQHDKLCELDTDLGTQVIRPWPLSDFLVDDVPQRVYELTHSLTKTQVPHAIITSRPNKAWLSDTSKVPHTTRTTFDATADTQLVAEALSAEVTAANDFVRDAILAEQLDLSTAIEEMRPASAGPANAGRRGIEEFADATARNAETFGPQEFASGCGFKVRGTVVTEVVCKHATHIHAGGEAVEILAPAQPVSALLVFASGYGALVAALTDFIGSLTLEEASLNDLSYEPSRNSWRWSEFADRETEIRNLRAVVAASSQQGIFRLHGDDADKLARRMQLSKSFDPSLALYAAHAYADQGDVRWLQQMTDYLRDDLGKVPLDIALLAGRLRDTNTAEVDWAVPFLPLLAQTWAFLPAYDVKLPAGLTEIQRHLVDNSLWSLYTPEGVELIRNAMQHEGLE